MKDDDIGAWPWPSSGVMRCVLAIGMLMLAACADTPPEAREATSAVGAETVEPPLMAAARKGDEAALTILTALADARGDQEAVMNYRHMAVEFGHRGAKDSLAIEYERRGDYAQAAHWFRRALEKSTFPGPSAFHLAELILSGRTSGTPKEGAEYMSYAAAAGSRQAARRLAELLKAGTGVERDEEESRLWLARAERDEAYVRRALVQPPAGEAPSLPVGQSERLREICERVTQGSLLGMVQLGESYETGSEVPLDHAKAAYWYAKAASLGSPMGHYALGAMIINGHRAGTQEEAAALIERASYAFVPVAEAAYGLAVMTGRGVPKDEGEGAYWIKRAAIHGNAWGKYLLAKAFLSGHGVEQDEAIGRGLMEEAAREGYRKPE
ncbi:MAG: hypothetical protein Q7R40_15215 [Phaeospirillum sp.]|nr:hypothetical protein [Phaeospirillum sp.]